MSKVGIQLRGTGAVRTGLRGGGIAKRGTGAALKTGGRAALWNGGPPNTGRTNLLEQLGRVEAERSNPNRRAEISRVHGELNRGYAKGGRAGFIHGKKVIKAGGPPTGLTTQGLRKKVKDQKAEGGWTLKKWLKDEKSKKYLGRPFMKIKKEKDWADPSETVGGRRIKIKGGPELIPSKRKDDVGVGGYQVPEKDLPSRSKMYKESRGLKDGGRIGFKKGTDKKWIQKAVDPKHKGYCTPMTKKTCTPARKALARTFKKKAKTGWG